GGSRAASRAGSLGFVDRAKHFGAPSFHSVLNGRGVGLFHGTGLSSGRGLYRGRSGSHAARDRNAGGIRLVQTNESRRMGRGPCASPSKRVLGTHENSPNVS